MADVYQQLVDRFNRIAIKKCSNKFIDLNFKILNGHFKYFNYCNLKFWCIQI